MAKKHRTRPALNAAVVWRWIVAGILEIQPIKGTPAFIIAQGKNVRQRWIRQRRDEIVSLTATTYLGLGIILVPRWITIEKQWRVDYLRARGLADRKHGFAVFEGQLFELCYQQVEDLDHCRRQQGHILKGYDMPKRKLAAADFETMMAQLERVAIITGHVAGRQAGADSLYTIIRNQLKSHQRSLRSFVENAPTLKGEGKSSDQRTLVSALEKMALGCKEIACHPLVRRLRRASRSLALAAEHIQAGRMDLARERILSALKNLEYPPPEATILPRWIA